MAGLDVLTPTAPDPNARLYERLTALEARLAAQERRRDQWITSRNALWTGAPSSSGMFQTHGGVLMIVHGGMIRTSVVPAYGYYEIWGDGITFFGSSMIAKSTDSTGDDIATSMKWLTWMPPAGDHFLEVRGKNTGGYSTSFASVDFVIIELAV